MAAYYNEIDPYAAQWLRELIKAGHIAPGDVDERSIEDVLPGDLDGYRQCHFFAGIGGWSYALRLAGWPDDRPIWTGSCPCQPFSGAGKGAAFTDARHLWPSWFRLIAECRPDVIAGEQVDAALRHGWLDLVFDDLEGRGYACWAQDLPSAGVGTPNIRSRLWWLADAGRQWDERGGDAGIVSGASGDVEGQDVGEGGRGHALRKRERCGDANCDSGTTRGLAAANLSLSPQGRAELRRGDYRGDALEGAGLGGVGESVGMADTNGWYPSDEGLQPIRRHSGQPPRAGAIERLADANDAGPQGRHERRDGPDQRPTGPSGMGSVWSLPSHLGGRPVDWLRCRDAKWRPVESGTFPLAHELPARVGRLRGYGNAINPEVAADVIRAYMEITADG